MPRRSGLLPVALLAAVAILGASLAAGTLSGPPSTEVRGLWVVRGTLTSSASITRMLDGAAGAGFNAVFVQVRGRGDAYYSDGLEPRAEALGKDTGFDPLAFVIREAHARRISVAAWITVNLVSSAHELPRSPGHLVNRSPEWLMVPRALAQELSKANAHAPGYVGKLARWTRSHASDVEGLYSSPVNPAAAAHTVAVVTDLVKRYDLDGVHLDYVRYPTADFDHSRVALDEFRSSVLPDLTRAEAAALDARRRDDALAYVDMYPVRWASFRRTRLTALVMRIRNAARAQRPALQLSAAVVPDTEEAATKKLQEWPRWMETALLDAACPMAYTQDEDLFASQIASAVSAAQTADVWAGIGAYRLTPSQTVARISTARRLGATGVVLFSYDSVTDPAQPVSYLADVGRGAFVTPRGAGGDR
jgi:uncharacterized lipoprotein YddW (UPF0748 family)